MDRKHVVIIGGGFGGTYTAKYLKPLVERDLIEITLINRTNYFLFTPLLHEVATGGLSSTSVVEPIREIFRHSNIHFIQDEVRSIDANQKQVSTMTTTIPYDYLVISSGAETNYYDVSGAKENTLALKDLRDAEIMRKQLIDVCEKGALTSDAEERRKILSCVIVGAGPTGVELAAEIIEFIHENLCAYYDKCTLSKDDVKVTLVSASPDVLPQFPLELRPLAYKELVRKGVHVITNECVIEVHPEKVIFADKSFIEAGTIIWVAGVKPISMKISGVEYEKSGRIKIDEFLRIKGSANSSDIFSCMYSLGDVSGTAPMLAQVAAQQARIVAHNISASISQRPLAPFKFLEKGLLVSIGQWYAVGKIFGAVMKGPLMWLVWRIIYLFNFHSLRKRMKIAAEWTMSLFYPRDITKT